LGTSKTESEEENPMFSKGQSVRNTGTGTNGTVTVTDSKGGVTVATTAGTRRYTADQAKKFLAGR
jgi:ribosomal protein S11